MSLHRYFKRLKNNDDNMNNNNDETKSKNYDNELQVEVSLQAVNLKIEQGRAITEIEDNNKSKHVDSTDSEYENDEIELTEEEAVPPREVTERKVKKLYKQKFKENWKDIFSWVEQKDGRTWCKFCNQILQGSKTQLERHADTDKHKKNAGSLAGVPQITTLLNNFQSSENSLGHKLVMFAVEHNLSFNSLDHLTKLVKDAATSHKKTVNNLKLSRTSGTKIVIEKFGPCQQNKLSEKLRNTKFSIIADESTDVSATKCLALTVRYFDFKVKSQFLCLIEVPNADAQTMFDATMKKFNELQINFANVIGYGADNASVMMGHKNGLRSKFEEVNPNLFSMGCVCHSLDLCSSAAAEKLPHSIEEFVHDIYNHFAHSAKKKFLFEQHQKLCDTHNHKILRHCETRWLSYRACVDRLIEQWAPLTEYFIEAVHNDNLQTTKNILSALKQPVFKLYLSFLSYTLDIVCKMNMEFQSEKSKIHKLHATMVSFYQLLLGNYMKRTYICSTSIDMINPENNSQYLDIKDIYVGPAAQIIIESGYIAAPDLKAFHVRVLDYYVTLCGKIRRKYDFKNPVLVAMSLIDPNEFLSNERLTSIIPLAKYFPNICNNLHTLDMEYRQLQSFSEIKKLDKSDPEIFWNQVSEITVGGKPIFSNIANFSKCMLCLPHSSAEVERIFSKINIIKTKLRNKLKTRTVEALLLSKDLLKEGGGHCYSFNLKSCKTLPKQEEDNHCDHDDDIDNIMLTLI